MNENVYRKLAAHLDTLPEGFSSNDPEADLRLLERLFSEEEAALAVHLTLERDSAETIAHRAGLPLGEAEECLKTMAQKGLIFSVQAVDSPALYQAVPFVIGIYEFQVNNLSKGLVRDLAYHWRAGLKESAPPAPPQIRTIPIGKSIETQMDVFSYEQVNQLVQSKTRFAVAPCICRRTAKMTGSGCDAPEESCLVFDEWADFYVQGGRGHEITQAEVYEILERADAANLVLQPSNSQDPSFICCCCGCCCGILNGLKRHPKPAEAAASAFTAVLDPDLCTACWTCLERCQMDALTEDTGHVLLNADRCIGCGLCVTTCPSGALTLERRPESEQTRIPATMDDTWRIISQKQAENR